MAQLNPPIPVESKFILWLKWTAAFVLAEAIMLPVMQYVPAFLVKLFPILNTYPNAIRLPIIILNGFVYGLFSAFAIRSYLPNFRLWIILSSTVWIIGSVVSISPVIQAQVSSSSSSTIFGIIASLVTLVPHGIIQWLMLRTSYQKSGLPDPLVFYGRRGHQSYFWPAFHLRPCRIRLPIRQFCLVNLGL